MKPTEDVVVLGPGCARCKALDQNTREAMTNLHCTASYNYITDVTTMASLGIMTAPALTLKGKVASTGKVLTVAEITALLKKNNLV